MHVCVTTIGTLSTQVYAVVKVGGGFGQGPATEVTHLRINQPPVFSSYTNATSLFYCLAYLLHI